MAGPKSDPLRVATVSMQKRLNSNGPERLLYSNRSREVTKKKANGTTREQSVQIGPCDIATFLEFALEFRLQLRSHADLQSPVDIHERPVFRGQQVTNVLRRINDRACDVGLSEHATPSRSSSRLLQNRLQH